MWLLPEAKRPVCKGCGRVLRGSGEVGVRCVARIWQVVPVLLLLTVLVVICSQMVQILAAKPPDQPPQHSGSTFCRRGNPLDGVYNPWRLKVIDSCITVTGTIVRVSRMADGDYHIRVRLDEPYAYLLNSRNESKQGGALVTEIVPVDRAGVRAPEVGDYVEVTGPYVLDKLHGWMEIHPVWEMRLIPERRPAP